MAYIVQNMKLIPQNLKWSCWYASAQMLINWKQEQRRQSIRNLIPPELDEECRKIRDDNTGIENPQILRMAKRLGLKVVPPQTATSQNIEGWLQRYGPLWVNGASHIVVIAGIRISRLIGEMALVYDPAPVNVGDIRWQLLSTFRRGREVESFDTSQDAAAAFLYCPIDP